MTKQRIELGKLDVPLNALQKKHFDVAVAQTRDVLEKAFGAHNVQHSPSNAYNGTRFDVKHTGILNDATMRSVRRAAGPEHTLTHTPSGFSVMIYKPGSFVYGYKTRIAKDLVVFVLLALVLVALNSALARAVPHKHSALLCHYAGWECHV